MKKTLQKILTGLTGVLLLFAFSLPALAADNMTVVEKYTTENGIALYVQGVEGEVSEAAYQVGSDACTVENITVVAAAEEPVRTLILWDNSLSVMNKHGDTIKNMLIDLVAGRAAGEEFAIAVLDKEVTYLTEYSSDYAYLKQVIEGMEGEDKDAYLIENLYEAIAALNQMQDAGYKRIIVISDGMDSTEIGYSKDELLALVEKTPYPVHTIGIQGKNNQNELQDMFAISRMTQAQYVSLGEIENTMSVVESINMDYNLLQVKIEVPRELQNGSTQNSQLTLVAGNVSYTAQSQVTLPFADLTAEDSIEETVTEPENTAENETEEGAPAEETKASGLSISKILLIGMAVIVAVLVAVIIILIRSRKKDGRGGNAYEELDKRIKNERHKEAAVPAFAPLKPQKTDMLQEAVTEKEPAAGNRTLLLFDASEAEGQKAKNKRIILTDAADAMKTYQCDIADKIIVGRSATGCNLAITTDNAVSEKHCEISLKEEHFYVEDLGSSNGTFLNGSRIHAAEELKTGCMLKIGRSTYRLTIEE